MSDPRAKRTTMFAVVPSDFRGKEVDPVERRHPSELTSVKERRHPSNVSEPEGATTLST